MEKFTDFAHSQDGFNFRLKFSTPVTNKIAETLIYLCVWIVVHCGKRFIGPLEVLTVKRKK